MIRSVISALIGGQQTNWQDNPEQHVITGELLADIIEKSLLTVAGAIKARPIDYDLAFAFERLAAEINARVELARNRIFEKP